jgi:tetratricopeptide (TPR) repeat protein
VREANHLCELCPEAGDVYMLLGFVLRSRGNVKIALGLDPGPDFEASLAACSKGVEKRPLDATAWLLRAYSHRDLARDSSTEGGRSMDHLKEAMADLDRALTLNPRLVDALRVRAMTHHYFAAREVDRAAHVRLALDDIDRAFAVDPVISQKWRSFHTLRGTILGERATYRANHGEDPADDFAEAIASLDAALRVGEHNADDIRIKAQLLANRGAWRAATGGDPVADWRASLVEYDRLVTDYRENPAVTRWQADREAVQRKLREWSP